MPSKAQIDEFLSHHDLALVRLSPTIPVIGGKLDEELGRKGYTIRVVYLDGPQGTPKLSDLAEPIEGAIIAVPKDRSEQAVREAIEAKMPRLWIQNGSDSKAAVELAEKNNMPLVYGACVMMYCEPVQSVHAFHRWLTKLFGGLAK